MGPNVQVFRTATQRFTFHIFQSATVSPHGSCRPENMGSDRKGMISNRVLPRARPRTQDNLVGQLIFLISSKKSGPTKCGEIFYQ